MSRHIKGHSWIACRRRNKPFCSRWQCISPEQSLFPCANHRKMAEICFFRRRTTSSLSLVRHQRRRGLLQQFLVCSFVWSPKNISSGYPMGMGRYGSGFITSFLRATRSRTADAGRPDTAVELGPLRAGSRNLCSAKWLFHCAQKRALLRDFPPNPCNACHAVFLRWRYVRKQQQSEQSPLRGRFWQIPGRVRSTRALRQRRPLSGSKASSRFFQRGKYR